VELNLADVKKAHFEETLKVYLIGQVFLPKNKQDSYHRFTKCAKRELEAKIPGFAEPTRQLILRSNLFDMITMIVRLQHEKDILFLAENGVELRCLQFASEPLIKEVIPILLNRDIEMPSDIVRAIVRNSSDMYELYMKSKTKHREIFPEILENKDCPPDLFVAIVNSKIKDPTVPLGYNITARLTDLLIKDKIFVVRKPSLVKEENQ
jgi:hypothetical protein